MSRWTITWEPKMTFFGVGGDKSVTVPLSFGLPTTGASKMSADWPDYLVKSVRVAEKALGDFDHGPSTLLRVATAIREAEQAVWEEAARMADHLAGQALRSAADHRGNETWMHSQCAVAGASKAIASAIRERAKE